MSYRLCDPGEARTLDPMIKSHLLYQLSYGVMRWFCFANAKIYLFFIFRNSFDEKITIIFRKYIMAMRDCELT